MPRVKRERSLEPEVEVKRRYTRRKVPFSIDEIIPLSYQPNNFDNSFNKILNVHNIKLDETFTKLYDDKHPSDESSIIEKGQCIYMLCEPPTEPFYLAKVLGFDKTPKGEILIKVCWFYRARDLNRRCTDSRLVYASCHMDLCPLNSFRGHVYIDHKSDIKDIKSYRRLPDRFYFDKLYDRYMFKMYDMIPTESITGLPPKYKKALHKRFQFVFVECGKANDLFSAPKHCDKCVQWCSPNESIQCSHCEKNYHLLCCDPPITQKPKRGFAWYCVNCFKIIDAAGNQENNNESSDSLNSSQTLINDSTPTPKHLPLKYERLAISFLENDCKNDLNQRRLLEEWPWRYLGLYSKLEDAMDLQDRPYARACSRLGSKYQCTSFDEEWHDHNIQYYDSKVPHKVVRRGRYSHKKAGRKKKKPQLNDGGFDRHFGTGEIQQLMPLPIGYKDDDENLPAWLKPRPLGYIERGGEDTSVLLWKSPSNTTSEKDYELVERYMALCEPVSKKLNVDLKTPNLFDYCLKTLMKYDYDVEPALKEIKDLTKADIEEPDLSEEEVKLFETGIGNYGSELHKVYQYVKTQSKSMIVRFYYNWKKTDSGHLIWDNFKGRSKNRKKQKFINGIDELNDEGSYNSESIETKKIGFVCMYCQTNHSLKWFCGPGGKLINKNRMEGLCLRCSVLWRKYAIKWEDPLTVLKREDKKYDYLIKKGTEFELIRNANLIMAHRQFVESTRGNNSTGDYKTDFTTVEGDISYFKIDAQGFPIDPKLSPC